jgi:hypothetical protein
VEAALCQGCIILDRIAIAVRKNSVPAVVFHDVDSFVLVSANVRPQFKDRSSGIVVN